MDTDTAPFDVAADDSSGDDDLLAALARIVDAFVWQPDGPRVAALAVLGQQRIHDALRAADVLSELDREHRPRRWGPGSDVTVCDVCQRAYPCSVRTALDGGLT